MSTDLRYHAQTNTYYIQIQGAEYNRINNKIKHIRTRLKYIQDEKHKEEKAMLEEKRRVLMQKKSQSQRYVKIPASDIPENASARPIYDFPRQIITVSPSQYAELLAKLQKKEA